MNKMCSKSLAFQSIIGIVKGAEVTGLTYVTGSCKVQINTFMKAF